MINKLSENEIWLLSYYRNSEISGSLFFGKLCKLLGNKLVQHDMTKHFADEAMHAWLWTDCISKLGAEPLKLTNTYQEKYLSLVGIPANLMEVLALTHIFEKRVIRQYAYHSRVRNLNEEIKITLTKIMQDEQWHLAWISNALRKMEQNFDRAHIESTLEKFWLADQEVYKNALLEHAERVLDLEVEDKTSETLLAFN